MPEPKESERGTSQAPELGLAGTSSDVPRRVTQQPAPSPSRENVDEELRQAIRAELERIEESARYGRQSQFETAKLWRLMNLVCGLPAAALAGIAGSTGLAGPEGRVPAAIMALLSAGFGAVLTFLNAARRSARAQSAANAYLALESDARILRTIDLNQYGVSEASATLRQLAERRIQVHQEQELPSFYAYWRGRRNVEKGRQTFEVDKNYETVHRR